MWKIHGVKAFVVTGAVISAVVGAGTSAQAAGALHMYEKNNFKGGHEYVTRTDKDLRNNYYDNGKKVDNNTSSVKNTTSRYVDLWQNVGCTGAHTTSYPHTQDKKLSNDAIKDNRLSCVKFR
ncbi:peptidase inhibitor family I36 protein [Streptomyces sp. NPDC057621]|uniref:Peptidase inhibitor family I36 protein n=1 Tax=Streptomyces liliiviolaceus TaxID=2823109 RepID=A0A941BFL0_9ACTN|nr:peptidase inhibitor family I36 protein [Streptomyces liliiviolaceus]MBQ0851789.1 peptidase inhibitor family I36 protein [Streptomyces liliiviolaceus]